MRRGLTLYEVVLALAIFAGSVAAISQTVTIGSRAALQSRLQSQAILLCQSKMGEVIAGAIPPTSVGEGRFSEAELDGWTWSMSVQSGPHLGISLVEVKVSYSRANSSIDTTFALTRLVHDPSAFTNSAMQGSVAEVATKFATALQTVQPVIPQQN